MLQYIKDHVAVIIKVLTSFFKKKDKSFSENRIQHAPVRDNKAPVAVLNGSGNNIDQSVRYYAAPVTLQKETPDLLYPKTPSQITSDFKGMKPYLRTDEIYVGKKVSWKLIYEGCHKGKGFNLLHFRSAESELSEEKYELVSVYIEGSENFPKELYDSNEGDAFAVKGEIREVHNNGITLENCQFFYAR